MSIDHSFCTQAGQTIRLRRAGTPLDEAPPTEPAVCLDMNRRCIGAKCPVTNAPTAEMALRIVRAGLASPAERARAVCPECHTDTLHDVVGWAQAVCTKCGAVRRWSELAKKP
jgi:hypothetical protein